MVESIKLEIHLFWAKENTDLSKCLICEEVIYSYCVKLFMQIGNIKNLKFNETDICICDSCANAAKIDIINA